VATKRGARPARIGMGFQRAWPSGRRRLPAGRQRLWRGRGEGLAV